MIVEFKYVAAEFTNLIVNNEQFFRIIEFV